MTFFLPMKKVPTATAQQKQFRVIRGQSRKFDRVQAYDPENVKQARALFETLLAPHAPKEMIKDKPVYLKTMWLYPTKQKFQEGKLKITRPDTDNIIKLLKDSMTKVGFWEDDNLVAIDETHKYYAEEGKSGILVHVEVLEE